MEANEDVQNEGDPRKSRNIIIKSMGPDGLLFCIALVMLMQE
jgi:hypothetical protein